MTPVVDLERVRLAEQELRRLVAQHPGMAARTAAFLSGDLPGLSLEAFVSDLGVPVKLPPELVALLDELVPVVEQDRDLAITLGRVTRASVARLALLYGVQRLRSELAGDKRP